VNRLTSLSNEAKLTASGLVLAAAGMLLEIGAGSQLYPTLTGPIVLVVGATLVSLQLGRWTAYAGLIIPLVLAIGLVVSAVMSPAFLEQLTGFDNLGLSLGSLFHVLGLMASVVGGLAMVMQRAGKQPA
jgi:hypothetical protein